MMTTEWSYENFKVELPRNLETAFYRSSSLGPSQAPELFTAPNLLGNATISPSAVVLVAAPAAVGKSFLARQLSSDLGAPYWDLSEFSLGSNFFTGTAVDSYEADGYSEFRSNLRASSISLVLDAVDEALVRAGRENFSAAVENLAELVRGATSPSVIIFGRDETINDTENILVEKGIAVTKFTVAYFNEEQALDFVLKKAKTRGAPVLKEFVPFMQGFEKSILSALNLNEWADARDFLGYSPVLDALATFYAREPNPIRLLQDARKDKGDSYTWQLLTRIMEDVLDREQDKFGNIFGAGNPKKYAFAASTYTPEAQIAYLLGDSDHPQAYDLDDPDHDGDPEWYAEVEDKIAEQLRLHPFLKVEARSRIENPLLAFTNSAFRDYVLARALADAKLAHPRLLEAYWRSPLLNPTPILAGLLFSRSVGTESPLAPSALGMIHDSHASGASRGQPAVLVSISLSESDSSSEMLQMYRIESREGGDRQLVTIDLKGTAPALNRGAAHCLIDFFGLDLRVGDGFADFLLSGNTVIVASSFESAVSNLRVRQGAGAAGVLISAETFSGATRRIDAQPDDSLRIVNRGERLQYPWHKYRIDVGSSGSAENPSLSLAMDLRRIVLWFTKPSMFGGGLRYPIGAAERLLAKKRMSAEVFAYLDSAGRVSRTGDEFVLNLPVDTRVILNNDLSDSAYTSFLFAMQLGIDGR